MQIPLPNYSQASHARSLRNARHHPAARGIHVHRLAMGISAPRHKSKRGIPVGASMFIMGISASRHKSWRGIPVGASMAIVWPWASLLTTQVAARHPRRGIHGPRLAMGISAYARLPRRGIPPAGHPRALQWSGASEQTYLVVKQRRNKPTVSSASPAPNWPLYGRQFDPQTLPVSFDSPLTLSPDPPTSPQISC